MHVLLCFAFAVRLKYSCVVVVVAVVVHYVYYCVRVYMHIVNGVCSCGLGECMLFMVSVAMITCVRDRDCLCDECVMMMFCVCECAFDVCVRACV